jgi:hypothetical protein
MQPPPPTAVDEELIHNTYGHTQNDEASCMAYMMVDHSSSVMI